MTGLINQGVDMSYAYKPLHEADGLGQMTFSNAWRTNHKYVLFFIDKLTCAQLIYLISFYAFIKVELEVF